MIKIEEKEEEEVYCYICNAMTHDELICDNCDRYYCEDCSYSYTYHYQYEGCQCYECAEQNRQTPLKINEVRDNAIKIIIK